MALKTASFIRPRPSASIASSASRLLLGHAQPLLKFKPECIEIYLGFDGRFVALTSLSKANRLRLELFGLLDWRITDLASSEIRLARVRLRPAASGISWVCIVAPHQTWEA